MSVVFARAAKRQSFLRLALEGPAGYGKTYTALEIATRLSPGKVAFVDTEAGSATKYADLFEFDVIELHPPFHPKRAVEAIAAAQEAGYGCVILDSLSHFWAGDGGLLNLVDEIARTKYRGDSHRAWKDAGDIQQALVDAVLRSRLHVIAAMRTKKDYVREEVEKDGRTQTRIRAAGTKTIQRDEFDYEFDIVGRFDVPCVMAIVKSRCAALPPETVIEKPGAQLVETLTAWLSSGQSLEEQDKAAAAAEKAAEKARKAGENAAAEAQVSAEKKLMALIAEKGGDAAAAATAMEAARAGDKFAAWLEAQTAWWEKQAPPFKVPEQAQAALEGNVKAQAAA